MTHQIFGPAGTATWVPNDPRWPASVSCWFLHCPDQSPGWDHYSLGIVHLRETEGAPPPVINVPHATHEVILLALDPSHSPTADNPARWRFLTPINVCVQIQLPDDHAAAELLERCAAAVVIGQLPAEPPLSGQVEPWLSTLLRTSAHYRGEEHAR